MAKVPYNPVPSIEPNAQGTPEINAPVTGAAFGENVGAAISTLGKTVEGAGDELFRRATAIQELDNRAEADNLATEYAKQSGVMNEEFKNLLGRDPKANLQSHLEKLEQLRANLRSNLTNPMSRRLYDSETRGQFARHTVISSGHAATQFKTYLVQTEEAKLAVIKNNAFSDPDSDLTFMKGLQEGAERIDQTAQLLGRDEAWALAEKKKFEQDMLYERTRGLAQKNPENAAKFLEANKDRFGVKYDDAQRIVQGQVRQVGSRIIADQVTAHLKDDPESKTKTLQQMFEEGDKLAKQYDPKDPVLADYVRQRIITSYQQSKGAKREYEQMNKLILHGAMMVKGPDGKLPTTIEELTADPRVKEAWQKTDPDFQRSVLKGLENNIRQGLVVQKTPEMMAEYKRLRGMAQTDPQAFVELDIPGMKLPPDWKQEFIKLQEAKTKSAESDPRVTHALGILRPMLESTGLSRQNNLDGYNQFVGSLQDALEIYQQDNKKLPKKEEIEVIGSQLLRQDQLSGWNPLNWFTSNKPFFQTPVPPDEAEKIRNSSKWREMGLTPEQVTDEMVRRLYINTEYKRLFARPPAKSSTGPRPPRQ